jgi:hypothetical protein
MDSEESLYATVKKLSDLVEQFRTLLHGDEKTRTGGILAEIDAQRSTMLALERRINRMHRPIIWLWLLGFVSFFLATALLIVAAINGATGANWLDVPPTLAGSLALFFAIVSATLLIAGFGWLSDER